MEIEKKTCSKKFMSTDSLWYEEERLNTFIDWPVKYISPNELASNGFYYLRTKDHCACAFCLGIIGAWEHGDSIFGEHKRHFPDCPLINGSPTPNVPLIHGNIIAKLNINNALSCEKHHDTTSFIGEDVCGTGKEFHEGQNLVIGGDECCNISLTGLGLPMYTGPKKKDYITYDSRLSTFREWPEKVSVTPEDLADAGFFYIGLSDHVRCFHCGNGLRNWESGDSAWEEHARWYPECHFILVKRGIEFIDEVRRINPPYIHTPPNQPSIYYSKGAKYNKFAISDEELSKLMDLEVIKATSEMGFSENIIKCALKKRLEQTGVPFFQLDHCIEAVLQVSEDELETVEIESLSNQGNKIAMYGNASQSNELQTEGQELHCNIAPRLTTDIVPAPQQIALPPLPVRERPCTSQQNEMLPSTSHQLNTVMLQLAEDTNATVELDEKNTPVELQNFSQICDETRNEFLVNSPQTINEERKETVPSLLENSNKEDLLAQADQIIIAAKIMLRKFLVSPSTQSSLQSLDEIVELSHTVPPQSDTTADDLTKELERMKEDRTCRVCMDSEMEVVFLPCTHMTACSSCAVTLSNCPICRGNIQYVIKPIIS